MLSLFLGSAVVDVLAVLDVGFVVVGVLEVAVVLPGRVVVVVGFVIGFELMLLGREDSVFFSALGAATLDLRSAMDVVGFAGALDDAVPTRDILLAAPEIPFFSSPELATYLVFSSAELLTDARDLCDAVVETVEGALRTVDVVVGRVGGLLSVVPLVVLVVGDDFVVVDPTGRLVVVVPEVGLLVAVVGLCFAGESPSFSFAASGLDFDSSPEKTVDSTGVAGGASSETGSIAGTGSEGASVGTTGSSVEAMVSKKSRELIALLVYAGYQLPEEAGTGVRRDWGSKCGILVKT